MEEEKKNEKTGKDEKKEAWKEKLGEEKEEAVEEKK